jgi:hypothetical protein
LTGVREHQSQLGTSVAMALQVHPGLLIGAEARYMRSYEGLAPNTFTGNALFLGPHSMRGFRNVRGSPPPGTRRSPAAQ